MNLFDHIKSVLEQNEKFCKEDKLFKNVVVEAALKLDNELLSLLVKDDVAKKTFFQEIENIIIFDKIKFQRFVSNKQFLPDSYTAFKNKIGLTVNDKYLTESKEVVLDFPFKDCVLEGGQSSDKQKKNEIFWNETLAPDAIDRFFEPKAFCNFKVITKEGLVVPEKITRDNFIIKGNNLVALHSIKKVFKSKIKFIYIDPPYNTGNDSFNYNDSFNHSTWLTFMKNRLEIAKELLSSDGVIFISCDDNEFAYLKVLMDEIFNQENFIEMFSWKKSDTPSNLPKKSKKVLEYILCYEKNKDGVKYKGIQKESNSSNGLMNKINSVGTLEFPINIVDTALKDGVYNKGIYGTSKYEIELLQDTEVKKGLFVKPVFLKGRFKWGQNKLDTEIANGTKISIRTSSFSPSYEKSEYEVEAPINYIDSKMGIQTTENAGKELTELFGKEVFTYPKSETLIEYLLNMVSNKLTKDDYVLDFHLGSGTTCAVAHKLGYKYIGIEQMDYINDVTIERLKKVIEGEQTGISKKINWSGGGSFVYMELCKKNEEYVDRIREANNSNELYNIWEQLKLNPNISYKVNLESFVDDFKDFQKLDIKEQKQVLISILDLNELYINMGEVNDSETIISPVDSKLSNSFYSLKI